MTTILIIVVVLMLFGGVAITDIVGGGNNGSDRLGARTFALNLGQLPGCPTHWDLDEIPVIDRVFDCEPSDRQPWNARCNRSSCRVLPRMISGAKGRDERRDFDGL